MGEKVPENVVLCVDASRSMYRSDYKPNRLIASIKALKRLAELRLEQDPNSAFAVIKFSDTIEKILDFTGSIDSIHLSLKDIRIGGNSAMGEALGLSIKVIIAELRKIGAKVPKILLVSDGNYTKTEADPLKMAQLANGLNIKIDTFSLGDASSMNILRKISKASGGRFYYTNSPDSLLESARSLAGDNLKSFDSTSPQTMLENPAFLRKIAADTLRVQDLTEDQEQRLQQLRGNVDYKKCSICFSDKDPDSGGTFFLTGRYCPNCNIPFHIHCLAGWASSMGESSVKQSGTCRCPHCFYLLRIPTEVTQVRKLRTLSSSSSKKIGPKEPDTFPAKAVNIDDLDEDALYNSCPVCNYIFEGGNEVIECGNYDCGALYHRDCFNKLANEQCKSCEGKLTLS